MSTDDRKYENATKSTWRGWAWNQVEKRLGAKARGATVMVLAGDIAADLEHADQRGMKCVGVDYRQECVDEFRRQGGVAVNDDLKTQAALLKPDAVIADLMGGLTCKTINQLKWWAVSTEVLVINMLRGRDKSIDPAVRKHFDKLEIFEYLEYPATDRVVVGKVGKHRGKQAAWILAYLLLKQEIQQSQPHSTLPIEQLPGIVLRTLKPSYSQYRSKDGGQWFDSVAMNVVGGNWTWIQTPRAKFGPVSVRKAAAAKARLTQTYWTTGKGKSIRGIRAKGTR